MHKKREREEAIVARENHDLTQNEQKYIFYLSSAMQKPAHNCAFSHSASFASLHRLAFCKFMWRKKLGREKVLKKILEKIL